MPTGPAHDRIVQSLVDGEPTQQVFPCRCMDGEDHFEGPDFFNDEDDGERLSPDAAEEIWLSNGMDEDYDFR